MRAYALLLLATAAACGGCSASPGERPVTLDGRDALVARRFFVTHVDHSRTWISPELAKAKVVTLFVSDAGTADVYIYKLPGLKVLAKVTGFTQPQGECADPKGNVWVADTNARIVYEFSLIMVSSRMSSKGYHRISGCVRQESKKQRSGRDGHVRCKWHCWGRAGLCRRQRHAGHLHQPQPILL